MFDNSFEKNLQFIIPNTINNIFYVKDFGSHNEKITIQKTIDECFRSGGGKVVVTKGVWKTAAIHLKSNVELHIEEFAEISFSQNVSDYLPVVFTRWEGMECYNYSPFIYADNCENIKITGKGILNGNGESWWHWKNLQQTSANKLCYSEYEGIKVEDRIYGTEKDALRPSFIQPINCKNILIEDITIKNSPQWNIHPVYCENIIIRGISILSDGPNTDGLNPDSCKNVLIENSFFSTGDDCIAINSGMNEDGIRVNKPCENILIQNCEMVEGHGAIVIGSGMSGGVKNVYVRDCVVKGGMQGIRLKSMRGRGGYVDNVLFENIRIKNVSHQAIQINMFYEFTTVEPKTSVPSDFKNIYIKNIIGETMNGEAIKIIGLPEHKLENIYLENIEIKANKAGLIKNIILNNVSIEYLNNNMIFENISNMNFENLSNYNKS